MSQLDPTDARRPEYRTPAGPVGGAPPQILPVEGKAALDRFIRVPWQIYADDPNWVPPLMMERREHLSTTANPYFSHAEAQLWVALRDGRPVGRISAQIDRAALAQHGDSTGHFGFLEADDDPAVFGALLDTAETWLRERGMTRVRGPFSLSINDESGVLIKGFDTPPSVMMGHARPYYAARIEEQGYAKAKDLIAYEFHLENDPKSRAAQVLLHRIKVDPRVKVRPLSRGRFREELAAVLDIFNDAWSDNWGFVPLSEAEIAKAAKDLKPLIHEDYVAIAEVEGRPVAFAVALPNLNEAIRDLNGSLLPFGWAKLLYRLKFGRIRSARLPLMGVRKEYHGTGLGAALAYAVLIRVYDAFKARGYIRGELSWILEDNLPTRRLIEIAGSVPYKTYRIYEKALVPTIITG